jgi:hypothetical protein
MTVPGGEAFGEGRSVELATPESLPSGIFGAGRYRTPEERDAEERLTGSKPIGYRGTGKLEWFKKWHEPEAPCCKCGVVTDRWVIGAFHITEVPWGNPTYKGHALCVDGVYPFCDNCERIASIAVLMERQANLEIFPSVREAEALYLAELKLEVAA